jgi:5-formyltetrahydrofolate cyclo-ligase
MMEEKKEIRRKMARQRAALSAAEVSAKSTRIVDKILKNSAFEGAACVALYKALLGEVDLESLFSICWIAGKRTAIPFFNPETRLYEMVEVDEKTVYQTAHYGILEPLCPALLSLSAVDLMILPGVAFTPNGQRLGRGGGYYDRLLEGFSGQTLGVAFDFQILPDIPLQPHDLPVDQLISNL